MLEASNGDCHLAVFCVVTELLHYQILKVSAWRNAMGAIAKKCEKRNGSHGKKTPWKNAMAPTAEMAMTH